MELRPHDLVRLKDRTAIRYADLKPAWADTAAWEVPFGVVRRAPTAKDLIPIGLRGECREQRMAAFTDSGNILECITPEELVRLKAWRDSTHLETLGFSGVLDLADRIFDSEGLLWGPAGSTGYELATGISVVKESSDLDLIICLPSPISVAAAVRLFDRLTALPVRTDVLLEMTEGAVALAEYARGINPIVLRTVNGPRLYRSEGFKD